MLVFSLAWLKLTPLVLMFREFLFLYYIIFSLKFFMDLTRKIYWNCKGIMGRDTSARIFALITKLDPLICCLVETRADSLRLDRFSPKINKRCDLAAIEANGYSSGILVFWKKKHIGRVTPMAASQFVLHLISHSKNWILSMVYNSCRIRNQCLLWSKLSGMTPLNIPWIIIGYFNAISGMHEYKGKHHFHYLGKARYFSSFISSNNLMDINFTSLRFTWCNNQLGQARR